MLADKQLSGGPEDWANLIARFGGNGLALKLVGENIRQVFGGDLRRVDLAGLALRQPYLAGIDVQDTSLAGAHLSEAVLAEAFDSPSLWR